MAGMTETRAPFGRWEPAQPTDVAELFGDLDAPWWIAGGFAIELALGRRVRSHVDIDVLLLRRDHLRAQHALTGWEWWAADPPGSLRPWLTGEPLPPGVHDVWCRPGPYTPWRIQLMVDESDGEEWYSRRDATVRRSLTELGALSPEGIPYLAPEVQLYYKAKDARPKDEEDLAAVLPALTDRRRLWLVDALTRTHGAHPWICRLQVPPRL